MEPKHPLHWPPNVPRTPKADRRASAFKVPPQQAFNDLLKELTRFGADAPIISTNAPRRQDGSIYKDALDDAMPDPGVAVYFTRNGRRSVFALDAFRTVWENLRAISNTIEAMRSIERNGAKQLFDQAFTGFAALPAPDSGGHWQRLGLAAGSSRADVAEAYKQKARKAGSGDALLLINMARDAAIKEIDAREPE